MNKIYRIVWNATIGKWVVASELATRRGKSGSSKASVKVGAVVVFGLSLAGMSASSWAFTPYGVGATSANTGNTVVGDGASSTNTTCQATADTNVSGQTLPSGCAVVIGNKASNLGNTTGLSVVIGDNASVSAGSSVAVGSSATAGPWGVAVGMGAAATVARTIAIGRNAWSTAYDAVSLGALARSSGLGSLAVSSYATATADYAMAVGYTSTASSTYATAIGYQASATNGSYSIAFGANAKANNAGGSAGSIAFGNSASTGGDAAIAIGPLANANVGNAIAIGRSTSATAAASNGIAAGTQASVSAADAIAVGNSASSAGTSAVAIGKSANGAGSASFAGGLSANASGSNSVALGSGTVASTTNATALGNGATTSVADGVALGSTSVASTAAGVQGFDPRTNAASSSTSATWKSTLGAVSVGSSACGGTRQITNVAAGTLATDAVNVAQLQAVGTHYQSVNDGGTQGQNYNNDGATGANSMAEGVGASATNGNAMALGTSALASGAAASAVGWSTTVSGANSGAFGTKSTVGGTNSYAIGNSNTVNSANSMALGNSINLAVGTDQAVALGNNAAVTVAGGVALGAGSNASRASGVAGYAPAKASTADQTAITATKATQAGVDVGSRQITGVGAGSADSDAVNVSQLKSVANLASAGWTATDGTNAANIGPGGKVTFKGDSNVTVAQSGADDAGEIDVQLAKNLDLSSTGSVTMGNTVVNNAGLTITGGPSVTTAGINAGSKTITNVAAGVNNTDAVNVSQLNTVANNPITFAGNTGTVAKKLGDTMSVKGGATPTAGTFSGGNVQTSVDTNGVMQIQIADAPKFGGVTINSGGTGKITGLTAGTADTDAVNVSQLNTAISGGSWTATDADGNDAAIKNGGKVTFKGDSNVTVAQSGADDAGEIDVQLAKNLDLSSTGSVTMGNTVVNNAGLTITGGPSVTTAGIDAGSKKITNLTAGTADTDAVNVSQLNTVATNPITFAGNSGSVAKKLGDTMSVKGGATPTAGTFSGGNVQTSVDTNGVMQIQIADAPKFGGVTINDAGSGKITGLTAGTAGTDAVNVDQLKTSVANSGWTATDADGNDAAIKNGGKVTFKGDSNVSVAQTGTDGAGEVDVQLAKNLDLSSTGSVTMGNTVVNNNGLTIAGGPSMTAAGVDGGSKKIINVAAGTAGTDAVNVDQLTSVATNPITFAGNSGSVAKKLGDTMSVKGGATPTAGTFSGGNVQTSVDANGVMQIQIADAPKFGGVTINDNASGKITGLTAGTAGTDAVNVDQLTSTVNGSGWTATDANGNDAAIKNGGKVTFKGDSNVSVAQSGTDGAGEVDVQLAKNIDLSSTGSVTMGNTVVNNNGLTIKNGPSITVNGVDAGSKTITNVAAGVNGTDAVNVDQLTSVATNPITFAGNTGSVAKKLGDTMSVKGGATPTAGTFSGGNVQTSVDTNGVMQIQIADAPKFGGVTINDSNSGKITGLTAGTADTDAVNVSQLNNVVANSGWTATDADGNDAAIKGNGKVTFKGDSNVSVAQTGTDNAGEIDVQLNKDLDLTDAGSVTMGNTVVNNDGLTIKDGPSITTAGVDAGSKTITNVAAGVNGTDAVNVSQLNTVANNPITFAGNSGSVAKKLGDTLAIQGGATPTAGTFSGGNVQTSVDTNGVMQIQMADAPKFGGVTINDSNGGKITGLTAGTADTDAVNVSQLNNVVANSGWTATDADGNDAAIKGNGKVTFKGDSNVSVAQTGTDNAGEIDVQLNKDLDLTDAGSVTMGNTVVNNDGLTIKNGPSITTAGVDAGSKTITNVAAGVNGTDAVNVDQLSGLANNPITFAGNSGSVAKKLGDTLAIQGGATPTAGTFSGGNVQTLVDTNGAMQIQIADAPKFGGVTINDGDSGKITGLTAGTAGTDAVNVDQLTSTVNGSGWTATDANGNDAAIKNGGKVTFKGDSNVSVAQSGTDDAGEIDVQLAKNLDLTDTGSVTMGNTVVNNNGLTIAGGPSITINGVDAGSKTITNVAAGVNGTDAVNVDQLSGLANNPITFAGNSGSVAKKLGDTLAIQGGATPTAGTFSGGNVQTLVDTNGAMQIQIADAPKFGGVTINDSNSGKITGLTAGTAGTDAVNVDQLTSTVNSSGWTATDANGNDAAIKNGGKVTFKGDSNVSVAQSGTDDAGEIDVQLAKNLDLTDTGSVTMGNTVVNNNGLTIAGGPSITTAGVDAGGKKIINVAAGDISSTSTDAVNGSQLNDTNNNIANVTNEVNNFAGDQSTANTTINGRGIRYVRTNDTGLTVDDAYAQGVGSTAVGYQAKSTGADALALGRNAVASADNSVALGANATTLADLTKSGYNPSTTASIAGTAPVGEVSMGSAGNERRVTNVAAGADDTDAVNVSQLKSVASLASAGWTATDGTTAANIGPNGTVTFKGDSNVTVAQSGTDNTGEIDVQLNKDLDLTDAGSVTMGNTVVNNDGLTIKDGPSITTAGVDAGSKTITNVAAGVNGTDAVNVDQLSGLANNPITFAGNSGSVAKKLGDTLAIQGGATPTAGTFSGGNVQTLVDTNGAMQIQIADAPKFGGVTINDGDSGKITGLTAGTAGTDAVNVDQLTSTVNSSGWTATDANGNDAAIKNGGKVTFKGDSNVSVAQSGTDDAGEIDVQLAKNLDLTDTGSVTMGNTVVNNNGLTIAGGPSITINGVDAGSKTITNVAAGVNGTDAVNVDQLSGLANNPITFAGNSGSVAKKLGDTLAIQGGATPTAGTFSGGNVQTSVDTNGVMQIQIADAPKFGGVTINDSNSGKITGLTAGTAGTDAVNVDQLNSAVAGSGWTATDANGNDAAIKNGGKVAFKGDSNVSVAQSGTDGAGEINVQLNKNLDLTDTGSVTMGNTVVNNNGLTITGGPSVTIAGVDAGGKKITNVAAGDVSADSTDAVNGSQLNDTNNNIANVTNEVNNFAGDQSAINTTINGRGIRYVRTNDTGLTVDDAYAQGVGSTAVGYQAKSTGANALALGRNAVASADNSVALGANATTLADLTKSGYNPSSTASIAGTSPVGEVSVGSAGAERRVTNVAAGADDTDAVNVSQLKSLAQTTNDLSDRAVKYDTNGDGSVNYNSVTMGGDKYDAATKKGGTKITNVADGVDPSDAVNMSQLTETNNNLNNITNEVNNFAGDQSTTNTTINGRGIRYVRTNDTGLDVSDSSAQGQGSTAVGYNATASADNSLALGRDSKANNAGDVALGQGSVTDTAVATTGATIGGTDYAFAGASPTSTVSVGSKGNERTITNVAAGRLSADSTDAVNGSQLYATNQAVDVLNSTINNINNGGGIKYFHANSSLDDSQALGLNSVAVGPQAVSGGANSVAIGNGAAASTANSVALGAGSTTGAVTGTSGTTIAGDSYSFAGANPTGTVSVGAEGQERTLTNVAAGGLSATSTDAVNGSQLYATNQAVNKLDGRVTNVENTVNDIAGNISNITTGQAGMFQTSADQKAPSPNATGKNSAAGGANAAASGENSLAVGNGSQASASNSVAIGNNSVADRANSVSVGSTGAERQITNVAVGTQDTDAVNVSQLKASSAGVVKYDTNVDGSPNYNSVTLNSGGDPTIIHNVQAGSAPTDAVNVSQLNDTKNWAKSYTDQQVNRVGKRADAGSAAAMAMSNLPQAYQPNQSSVGVGIGNFRGQSAIAIGMSTISESGRYIFKASATRDQQTGVGVGVGAGMVW
nr:ESPR-type extended signal peptide-containing protein [Dyella sp. ASV24]